MASGEGKGRVFFTETGSKRSSFLGESGWKREVKGLNRTVRGKHNEKKRKNRNTLGIVGTTLNSNHKDRGFVGGPATMWGLQVLYRE